MPFFERIKNLFLGSPLNPRDPYLFQKISLIAFFAWIGLGADGLSSSCYGPSEAFLALKGHIYLSFFVGLATVFTIFIICTSYSQIIELFPAGGGGYLVASKLLNPTFGMISGCALIVDYVLTIALSIASGTDAILSFLPPAWANYKLSLAMAGVIILIALNIRGVKESVVPLVPVFLTFVLTHAFAIVYALINHAPESPQIVSGIISDTIQTQAQIGFFGLMLLILHAYSMGAGTYTGIEAVSNSIPILKEPRVKTAKRTMDYMAFSLAIAVMGLFLSYLLYRLEPEAGKTLNASLFERMTTGWPGAWGSLFVKITLISEAALLFVAAQTGFLGGPRVLANMATDRWVPSRFMTLSDRFVTQNGVFLMGGAALLIMLFSGGSVKFLVVLYAINVFITFVLSQLGMVRHWWSSRAETPWWKKKILINGIGLALCSFILISVTVLKFNEGGWITLFVTGALIAAVIATRRHYAKTSNLLKRLDELVAVAETAPAATAEIPKSAPLRSASGAEIRPVAVAAPRLRPTAKTAVILVNGFNGLGLHTVFGIIRNFGETFKNFVFIQIGVLDTGSFKGSGEIEKLEAQVKADMDRYVKFMQRNNFYAEAHYAISNDIIESVTDFLPKILERFPQAIFFGGQLVFPHESIFNRWLHGYTIFALQRELYKKGTPLFIMPIRV